MRCEPHVIAAAVAQEKTGIVLGESDDGGIMIGLINPRIQDTPEAAIVYGVMRKRKALRIARDIAWICIRPSRRFVRTAVVALVALVAAVVASLTVDAIRTLYFKSSSRSSQPSVDERKTRAIAATSSGAAKQCARVLFSSGTSFYPKLTSGEPGLTASVFPAAILTSSDVGSNVRSRAAGTAVIRCIAHLKSAWRVLLTGSSRGFVSGEGF